MASKSKRRKQNPSLQAESLETRSLLTAGAGNNFAIVQANIDKPNVPASIPFTLTPKLFTRPGGKITIGIDVAQQSNSTVKPFVFKVTDAAGKIVPIRHARYNPTIERTHIINGNATTSATLTLRVPKNALSASQSYKVEVQGQDATSGGFLVGFYLPGDANGTGVVDAASIKAVRSIMGSKAGSTRYNFAADADRNGQITVADLNMAMQNKGVKTTVSPVVSANLDAASDTGLQDRITTTANVKFTGNTTPGATVTYLNLNGTAGGITTTANEKGDYSVDVGLSGGSNTFQVTTVDAFGQTITGTIAPVTQSPNAPPSLT